MLSVNAAKVADIAAEKTQNCVSWSISYPVWNALTKANEAGPFQWLIDELKMAMHTAMNWVPKLTPAKIMERIHVPRSNENGNKRPFFVKWATEMVAMNITVAFSSAHIRKNRWIRARMLHSGCSWYCCSTDCLGSIALLLMVFDCGTMAPNDRLFFTIVCLRLVPVKEYMSLNAAMTWLLGSPRISPDLIQLRYWGKHHKQLMKIDVVSTRQINTKMAMFPMTGKASCSL